MGMSVGSAHYPVVRDRTLTVYTDVRRVMAALQIPSTVNGKLWGDIERRGKPSTWITLRVLRVVKAIEAATLRL